MLETTPMIDGVASTQGFPIIAGNDVKFSCNGSKPMKGHISFDFKDKDGVSQYSGSAKVSGELSITLLTAAEATALHATLAGGNGTAEITVSGNYDNCGVDNPGAPSSGLQLVNGSGHLSYSDVTQQGGN